MWKQNGLQEIYETKRRNKMHCLQQAVWRQAGLYSRGKLCGNLKVCRPSELLRSPARTPSRQPLCASGESAVANVE